MKALVHVFAGNRVGRHVFENVPLFWSVDTHSLAIENAPLALSSLTAEIFSVALPTLVTRTICGLLSTAQQLKSLT